jgi:hypothetical protein
MDRNRRSSIAIGAVLILLGLFFLIVQAVPGLRFWMIEASWPLIIVGVGVLLLVIGLLANVPGMAVPACIVGGIGLLLYWQNATGYWESWAYAWALIPGFVGVGIILTGLLEGKPRSALEAGAWLIVISLILFAIFGSFLGGPAILGKYWPVLLILLGLLSLGRNLFRPR